MTDRELMQQALEALQIGDEWAPTVITAITALSKRLEQPEQRWVKSYAGGKPNYTTPEEQTRQWQRLTDEEIDTLYEAHYNQYGECKVVGYGYERAIEAKLKEKNK